MKAKFTTLALLTVLLVSSLFMACVTNPVKFELYFRVDGQVYCAVSTTGHETIAVPRDPEKEDYTFKGWYWDEGIWEKPFTAYSLLDAPISSNMSVYAKFVKIDDQPITPIEPTLTTASYKVEYYLENILDNGYTKTDEVVSVGTISQEVTAAIKEYAHFTATESEVKGTVNKEGTLVLKVYYTRDVYTVTFNGNGGTLVSGTEVQNVKYLASATAPTYTKKGYAFVGFDVSFTQVTSNLTVTAQWGDPLKENYDMSSVKFENETVTYDGKAHSIEITGDLPEGVTVTYEGNSRVDAGTYTVTAKFKGDTENYNAIKSMTAKLVIQKAKIDISGVRFDDYEVEYDGEAKSIIAYNLPKVINKADVIYSYYKNGKEVNEAIDAGTYIVVLDFNLSDNYESVDDLTATLTITRETFADDYAKYTALGKTIDLVNADSLVTVSGGKSVFNNDLYYMAIDRANLGRQDGVIDITDDMADTLTQYSEKFAGKVSFGARQDKNGKFMTNKWPTMSLSLNGEYEKSEKIKTLQFYYTYSYTMSGYRVDIKNYRDPDKFKNIISDELKKDAQRVQDGKLSAAEFIKMWGTHVVMSAIYGETVDVTYTAISNEWEKAQTWKDDLEAELSKRFMKSELNLEGSVATSFIKSSSSKHSVTNLTISVTSNKALAATSLDSFVSNYNAWLAARDDNGDYAVFSDLPDNSLYCIWYLLGDEYAEAINILDEYMYSHASKLYQEKVDAINSLMFESVAFEAETGTLSINLDTFQQKGVVPELDGSALAGGVYKITPYYQGKQVKKVVVNGAYGTRNTSGQIIQTIISPFSIKIDKDWIGDLDIVINNVGITTASNYGFIDLSEAPNVKVNLEYRGTNIIQAYGHGQSALVVNDLTITSNNTADEFNVKGSNGAHGAYKGASGQDGGCAIVATNVTINANGSFYLYGGNGGNGVQGSNGDDGTTLDGYYLVEKWHGFLGAHIATIYAYFNGTNGARGYNGGNGGNGAKPITCDSFVVKNGTVKFVYGDGGNGGNGGTGGRGGKGHDFYAYGTGVAFVHGFNPGGGGRGGDGGNGGDAGRSNTEEYTFDCSNIEICAGKNGTAGRGGNGGNGGEGGKGGDYSYGETRHYAFDAANGADGDKGDDGKTW